MLRPNYYMLEKRPQTHCKRFSPFSDINPFQGYLTVLGRLRIVWPPHHSLSPHIQLSANKWGCKIQAASKSIDCSEAKTSFLTPLGSNSVWYRKVVFNGLCLLLVCPKSIIQKVCSLHSVRRDTLDALEIEKHSLSRGLWNIKTENH